MRLRGVRKRCPDRGCPAVAAIAASSDHGSARLILMASIRLHTIVPDPSDAEAASKNEGGSAVRHLQSSVSHHGMWQNGAFWSGIFFDGLTCRLEKSHNEFLEQGAYSLLPGTP